LQWEKLRRYDKQHNLSQVIVLHLMMRHGMSPRRRASWPILSHIADASHAHAKRKVLVTSGCAAQGESGTLVSGRMKIRRRIKIEEKEPSILMEPREKEHKLNISSNPKPGLWSRVWWCIFASHFVTLVGTLKCVLQIPAEAYTELKSMIWRKVGPRPRSSGNVRRRNVARKWRLLHSAGYPSHIFP